MSAADEDFDSTELDLALNAITKSITDGARVSKDTLKKANRSLMRLAGRKRVRVLDYVAPELGERDAKQRRLTREQIAAASQNPRLPQAVQRAARSVHQFQQELENSGNSSAAVSVDRYGNFMEAPPPRMTAPEDRTLAQKLQSDETRIFETPHTHASTWVSPEEIKRAKPLPGIYALYVDVPQNVFGFSSGKPRKLSTQIREELKKHPADIINPNAIKFFDNFKDTFKIQGVRWDGKNWIVGYTTHNFHFPPQITELGTNIAVPLSELDAFEKLFSNEGNPYQPSINKYRLRWEGPAPGGFEFFQIMKINDKHNLVWGEAFGKIGERKRTRKNICRFC